MYPGAHAVTHPDKPAVVMATTGETVTYRELDERSNRLAQLLRDRGLRAGDAIAIFMDNNARYLEMAWAAQRSGLYYTAVSSKLSPPEVAYIVNDCGAKAFLASKSLAQVATDTLPQIAEAEIRLMTGGTADGFESYEDAVAAYPPAPIEDEVEGADMLYSSGTTGRPKGVKVKLPGIPVGSEPGPLTMLCQFLYGFGPDTIYLSPAPMYHSAPLRFTVTVTRLGGTVVMMERFEPEDYLAAVERYSVTHSQVVPTMFVRMLKLPEETRKKYDVSSLQCVIHAAAPCPIPVKQQMIEWFGPIINEYYAGTEGVGFNAITSEEWLAHPGSVGRTLRGTAHILDEDGKELPPGEAGTIWFEGDASFEYHNDPEKTKSAYNDAGWATLGDVGYLDDEGYLYLTDRKAYMIISGGVNIYPQEAENLLVTHPKVMDVAVFGVPNEEFGEEVKAVVQPMDPAAAGPELEQELLEFCRANLAHYKCPRTIDFDEELPRHPTGKLYKRLLRDRYWTGKESRIV
ncbi:MAG TPA: AMP-binding protein [Mycobacteriales bacterium]|jgi:acyl-CoA synthetase (AMP-forming)/AMP-acid ligase II|nr:AMP-binding protein [Mycobacteriales bacterium]